MSASASATAKVNSIIQGDSVQLLRDWEAETVDLVFADPPFNIGYDYDVYDDARESHDYLSWCHEWIEGVYRVLKPDGTFWLAIGDEFAAELKIEAQKMGFHCRSWVIWYYTFGVNCRNGFSRSHTHLFHFIKNPKRFTFNRQNPQIRVKSARQLVYADNRANPDGRLPDNTWIIRPQDAPLSFSPSHDTWYFARVAGTFKEREGFHGCQMPEQLLARIIRASSHPQDLVLDPFGGSGTTLSVAKKLGRRYLGFELSEEYVRFIQQRLDQTEVGDPIDGPADPIESAPSTARGKRRKPQNQELEDKGLIEAYRRSSLGFPADHLLCDPELNADFVHECQQQRIDGNPYFWNRKLLQLRKSARLPASTRQAPPLTARELDEFGYASEVAWRLIAIDYEKTLDDILCSPDFAAEFDRLALAYGPTDAEISSKLLRRAAISIRKRCHQSRKMAEWQFADWISPRKKYPVSLAATDDFGNWDQPGVFVLRVGEVGIHVGATSSLKRRIENLQGNENWQQLEWDQVDFVPCPNKSTSRFALLSAIAQRERPLLNCRLWNADSELSHRQSD